MFVIPCKYSDSHNNIINLVRSIREFHKDEEIVVVDSDSDDKSYFSELEKYNVIIEDVKNKNYHIGAYWHAFKKYNREFYYFLHDSVKVKANLDYLKNKEFSCLAHFNYGSDGDIAKNAILENTSYKVSDFGYAIYGPIFFAKRNLLEKLHNRGVSKILPTYSEHSDNKVGIAAYAIEGMLGSIIAAEGFNIPECSILGDIIKRSGGPPQLIKNYDSSWQYPIEKFLCKRK